MATLTQRLDNMEANMEVCLETLRQTVAVKEHHFRERLFNNIFKNFLFLLYLSKVLNFKHFKRNDPSLNIVSTN